MKAAVYHRYGSPDMLHLEEVEKPMPKADEVLVKVHAASVNSWDWDLVTGKPRVYRLMFGLLRPKYRGRIRPGQKVLINGAGGGVGTFAIQMAKLSGATVTAVDHATKLDLLKAVGAEYFTSSENQFCFRRVGKRRL